MNTFILRGTLNAESPIAYTLPGTPKPKNAPTPLPRFRKIVNDDAVNFLYVTGSGISGALRRACADVFIDQAKLRDQTDTPLTLNELRLAWVGGVGESGERNQGKQAKALMRLPEFFKANPILELFGAGSAGALNFVASRLMIENAVATDAHEPIVMGQSVRARDFTRTPERLALLDDDQYEEYQSTLSEAAIKSKLNAKEKDLTKQINDGKKNGMDAVELEALEAEKAEVAEQKKNIKDITDLLPLNGFEAIPQGTKFDHRMILRQGSDVALGTLLLGLDRFAKDGAFVGGHRKHGCGQLSGTYTITKIVNGKEENVGTVSFNGFTGISYDGEKSVEHYIDAAHSFLVAGEFDLSLPTI